MNMGTIRIFLVASIDGFYLPLDLQRFHGFDVLEYENLYRDVDIILTNPGGYVKLENKEANMKKQMYKVTKDLALLPYSNADKIGLTSVDQLKEVGKKNVLVIGNDNKLTSYLLNKDWVDEIIVCTIPVTSGTGKRSFPTTTKGNSWVVKGNQFFDRGVTIAFYEKEVRG